MSYIRWENGNVRKPGLELVVKLNKYLWYYHRLFAECKPY